MILHAGKAQVKEKLRLEAAFCRGVAIQMRRKWQGRPLALQWSGLSQARIW